MKKYNVTVNGESFIVEVEELGGSVAQATQVITPAPQAAPAATAAAPAPQPKATSPGTGIDVISPLPGTVLKINVSEGQAVKAGDILLVLEAMKMENDITAPEDGTVKSISVKVGQAVQTDDLLITI